MRGPLAGVLVLDLSRLLPGPFATQLMADLGARVIKVEEPATGDYARAFGAVFGAVNRGKESVAIDLKSEEGRGIVRRLAARADVLVDSFRPGVLARLGLDPKDLARENPRLVVLHLSGYGQSGARRDDAGHDLNYQSLAGLVALNGRADAPMAPSTPVADLAGGLYGVVAVLAALHERARTGRGTVLDVALADAALALAGLHLARAADGEDVRRGSLELAGALPAYDVYGCADGRFLALACLEPKFWDRFCDAVARAEWRERHLDPGLAPELKAFFATRPRDAWAADLAEAGVPATPVLEPAEVLASARLKMRIGGVPAPGSPVTHRALAGDLPGLGAATDAVLAEIGYSPEDVARLRAARVVA